MDNFNFIVYYIISTPGFFKTNMVEILGLVVNFILAFITLFSVIVALYNSFRILKREDELEKQKNIKTVNVINQLTYSQRKSFISFSSQYNHLSILTRTTKKKVIAFTDNYHGFVDVYEHQCLFNGLDLLIEVDIEKQSEEHLQQLKEILFDYHINLDIFSADKISKRIETLERISSLIVKLDINTLKSDHSIVKSSSFLNSKYSQLEALKTLIEEASKEIPTN